MVKFQYRSLWCRNF